MSASLSHKANAEPNLTPVLDMVFQLITFFMLVINFKANLIDKAMELPIVGSARPIDKDVHRAFFMVNLNNKGQFTVYGRPYTDAQVPAYIANQAIIYQNAQRRADPNYDPKTDDSEDDGHHSGRQVHAVRQGVSGDPQLPGKRIPQLSPSAR